MIYVLIFFTVFNYLFLTNYYYNTRIYCNKIEKELIEYRKIKRKLNRWRFSQEKFIEILDNGISRLKKIRLIKKNDN